LRELGRVLMCFGWGEETSSTGMDFLLDPDPDMSPMMANRRRDGEYQLCSLGWRGKMRINTTVGQKHL
jgi:hypothetical protein